MKKIIISAILLFTTNNLYGSFFNSLEKRENKPTELKLKNKKIGSSEYAVAEFSTYSNLSAIYFACTPAIDKTLKDSIDIELGLIAKDTMGFTIKINNQSPIFGTSRKFIKDYYNKNAGEIHPFEMDFNAVKVETGDVFLNHIIDENKFKLEGYVSITKGKNTRENFKGIYKFTNAKSMVDNLKALCASKGNTLAENKKSNMERQSKAIDTKLEALKAEEVKLTEIQRKEKENLAKAQQAKRLQAENKRREEEIARLKSSTNSTKSSTNLNTSSSKYGRRIKGQWFAPKGTIGCKTKEAMYVQIDLVSNGINETANGCFYLKYGESVSIVDNNGTSRPSKVRGFETGIEYWILLGQLE